MSVLSLYDDFAFSFKCSKNMIQISEDFLIVEVINQNNYYRLIHHSLCIIEQSSALTEAIFNL